jgi:hypothetical protein
MRFYSEIQKISLAKEAAIKAWRFAKKVVATTDYSDSNQRHRNKILIDHFVSKLGEEAAKEVLSQFSEVVGPDYNIYIAKEKSWEDDLFVNDVGVAVKTQLRRSALQYGLSWTFQSGEIRRDLILDRPEAWVIFVECDEQHPYEMYVYPPLQVKELVFGEPKLQHLKGHKKVVYADTLKLNF